MQCDINSLFHSIFIFQKLGKYVFQSAQWLFIFEVAASRRSTPQSMPGLRPTLSRNTTSQQIYSLARSQGWTTEHIVVSGERKFLLRWLWCQSRSHTCYRTARSSLAVSRQDKWVLSSKDGKELGSRTYTRTQSFPLLSQTWGKSTSGKCLINYPAGFKISGNIFQNVPCRTI